MDAAVGAAHLAFTRGTRELNEVDHVFALGLEVDSVDVPRASHVDLTGGHRLLGTNATVLLGRKLDVHTVLLVVAKTLGELVRQVDLLVDASHHHLDGGNRAGVGGGAGASGAAGREAERHRSGGGYSADLVLHHGCTSFGLFGEFGRCWVGRMAAILR